MQVLTVLLAKRVSFVTHTFSLYQMYWTCYRAEACIAIFSLCICYFSACIKNVGNVYVISLAISAVGLHSLNFEGWRDHQDAATYKLVNVGQLLLMFPCAPGRQKDQAKKMICQ